MGGGQALSSKDSPGHPSSWGAPKQMATHYGSQSCSNASQEGQEPPPLLCPAWDRNLWPQQAQRSGLLLNGVPGRMVRGAAQPHLQNPGLLEWRMLLNWPRGERSKARRLGHRAQALSGFSLSWLFLHPHSPQPWCFLLISQTPALNVFHPPLPSAPALDSQ